MIFSLSFTGFFHPKAACTRSFVGTFCLYNYLAGLFAVCLLSFSLPCNFMVTSCCCCELFLFGFHFAALKIIILLVVAHIAVDFHQSWWFGCCLEMAKFLSVACCVAIVSLSLLCLTLLLGFNCWTFGGSLFLCSRCFSITVISALWNYIHHGITLNACMCIMHHSL